jgi:hypothetical protein
LPCGSFALDDMLAVKRGKLGAIDRGNVMAQVTISEEQNQSLAALARQRGLTPDRLIGVLIELLEREDQLAFWGEGIVENLARQMATAKHPGRYLSAEEFFC